jgi:hypothetical protein
MERAPAGFNDGKGVSTLQHQFAVGEENAVFTKKFQKKPGTKAGLFGM